MERSVIQAIETLYKGYRFRSRLEARWAVFFDEMGLAWRYESEGYKVQVAGETRCYLPDFWLPDLGTWCEVKGSESGLDLNLLAHAALPDTGLPVNPEDDPQISATMQANASQGWPWPRHRMLLLGPIPEDDSGGKQTPVRFHTLLSARFTEKGWAVSATVAAFLKSRSLLEATSPRGLILDGEGIFDGSFEGLLRESLLYGTASAASAYDAARMARFEHGESGERRG